MGSFRSEPETKKHTVQKTYEKYSYAVSHMCGKLVAYSRMETLYGRCSSIYCTFQ